MITKFNQNAISISNTQSGDDYPKQEILQHAGFLPVMENAFENVWEGDDGGENDNNYGDDDNSDGNDGYDYDEDFPPTPASLFDYLAGQFRRGTFEMSVVFDLSRAHPRSSSVDVISRIISSKSAVYHNSVLLTLSRIMPRNQGTFSLPAYAYLHFFLLKIALAR